MNIEFILTEGDLQLKIEEILSYLVPYKIWLLEGEMGVGKTTLVNAIAAQLGDADEASSPSYTLINEYQFTKNRYQIEKLYHLDLYRLEKISEALDIGIEDVLYGTNICIIEWPEIILPLLSHESVVHIRIERVNIDERKYQIIKGE
ncbi:MAG: tRNA (adenosine(37)-N6)-threonylcarbamoyltransferase complex ATPase subunit type 1 TsaE [Saprospiraceae bacterium]